MLLTLFIMRIILYISLILCFGYCTKKVDPVCMEKPLDGRMCNYVLKPVCGCNGKTYNNECIAQAYGITNYKLGKCEGE